MANPKLAQGAGDRRQQCSFSNVGAAFWGFSLTMSRAAAEVVHQSPSGPLRHTEGRSPSPIWGPERTSV
jgi:hypothetical protein